MSDWTRYGACTHCGWCCTRTALTHAVVDLSAASDVAYFRTRGFQLLHVEGRPVQARAVVDVVLRCPEWRGAAGEPGCQAYEARPRTCRDFPTHPDQIASSQCPCTYWFERTAPGNTIERRTGGGTPSPPWEHDDGTVAHLSVQHQSSDRPDDPRLPQGHR